MALLSRSGISHTRRRQGAASMTFKVQVGPPQIAIHQGQTVLVTDSDGQIAWPSDKGLYFFDTRVISAWAIYANGQDWDLLNGGAGHVLRLPRLSHQPGFPHGGRLRTAAHARADRQPFGQRRAARGSRSHQLRVEAGALQPRDRDALGLRRHLRGEIEPHRAARPDHHRLVGGPAATPHHLSQRRFSPRASRSGRITPTRAPSTPTDG